MDNFKNYALNVAFEALLDLFLQADPAVGYSRNPDDDEINLAIEEMAAGMLAPDGVEELFSKLRSDPSAVARLASLLMETKNGSQEG